MKRKIVWIPLLILIILIGGGYFYTRILTCGFAITYGRNIFTNECKMFPDTCIPPWYRDDLKCYPNEGRPVLPPYNGDSYTEATEQSYLSNLLPNYATIVESQNLSVNGIPNRLIVLWMINPKGQEQTIDACPLMTFGRNYFEGPTRISLIDIKENKILRTLKVTNSWEKDDTFQISRNIQKWIWESNYGPLNDDMDKNSFIVPRYFDLKTNSRDELQVAKFVTNTTCISEEQIFVEYIVSEDELKLYVKDEVNEDAVRSRIGE